LSKGLTRKKKVDFTISYNWINQSINWNEQACMAHVPYADYIWGFIDRYRQLRQGNDFCFLGSWDLVKNICMSVSHCTIKKRWRMKEGYCVTFKMVKKWTNSNSKEAGMSGLLWM
jgi:hypothetical protein